MKSGGLPTGASGSLAFIIKHGTGGDLPEEEGGAAAVAPPFNPDDTYSRIRAACTGAPYMDLDKHAAMITEVVALARSRGAPEFTGRDEASAS